MPRPLKVDRPHRLDLHIPESLFQRLRAHLYSELEARVPHGSYSTFITELVQRELTRIEGSADG